MTRPPALCRYRRRVFALLLEVSADESDLDWAREGLPGEAVPRMLDLEAVSGYWLAPQGGRGVAVVLFETEDQARRAAAAFEVGGQAGPVPEVAFRTVEVREVLARL